MEGYVKLQIPAGKATPAPPVGPALGQHGVNIAAFTKEFNERTKNDVGMIIPVIITVYAEDVYKRQGLALTIGGWKMTGEMTGLIIMLVGLVMLILALAIYNKPFQDERRR